MALNTHASIAGWNLALNAMLDTPLASGTIKIYTGTQPATPDTALSGNTLLATLTIGATAFGAAASGVATANAITSGTAVATGTATFFRCFQSNGTTAVLDGSVGTATADMILNTTTITSGGTVSITAWTVSMPAAQ
jgi:hypothetical protein